jgi:hypothetical protein
MKIFHSLAYPTLAVASVLAVGVANAASVSVLGTDVVYCPGNLTCATNAGGTVPGAVINVVGVSSLQFLATGSVVLNLTSGDNSNDPDGVGAAPGSSYNTGTGIYAGISAPYAGYLTGLFTGSDTATGTPTSYTLASEAASSFSPSQNQAFFIGDGLTGDGTGAEQTFYVPTGATTLYLGISDSCGYGGGPSCYGDNGGSFSVSYTTVASGTPSTTPEPSSLVLLATGLASAAAAARRKYRK